MKMLTTAASFVLPMALLVTLMSMATSCMTPPAKQAVCQHPAILGGMPFPVPGEYGFMNDGGLHIRTPEGEITLYGAVCIVAPKK